MLTLKLKIKNICDVDKDYIKSLQQRYSYAFRKMYANFNSSNYRSICEQVEKKFDLNSWFMASLQIEVKTKAAQVQTQKTKAEQTIVDVDKAIKQLESKSKLDKQDSRRMYKLKRKQKELNLTLSKNIVFGGKHNLQRLGFLSNQKSVNSEEINNLKELYKTKRLIPICSVGDADKGGNRFFKIQTDSTILFKPNRDTKIQIEVYASKSRIKLLDRIRFQMENKLQPISLKISTDFIWISYDEQVLNNFGFKTKELKEELKLYPKTPEFKAIRASLARKFHLEQIERQLENKKSNRYLAVDLNPQFIGWSVCDYVGSEQKIIDVGCFDLSNLGIKLKLSSTDKKQVYQNNKRKFEISQIWKSIFQLAEHFKVGSFVMEDLNFKPEVLNDSGTEGNRKCLNIWHRDLTTKLITKYTNQTGIQLIEVNPAYSSFIGNLVYEYFDPTNASLEINRRGALKYRKESFYPEFNLDTSLNAMSSINRDVDVRDVLMKECLLSDSKNDEETWVGFYKKSRRAGLKYRRCLEDVLHRHFSLNNKQSNVNVYSFI